MSKEGEVALAHVSLTGFNGAMPGVERVMYTQYDILKSNGIGVTIIVGETDHPDPISRNIFVLPEIRSGQYLDWADRSPQEQLTIIDRITRDVYDIIGSDARFLAHNTTNMVRHNPGLGVSAAHIITQMAETGGVAILGVHDARSATDAEFYQFLPSSRMARIVCVSDVRRTQFVQRVAKMRSEGFDIPDYIHISVLPNPIDAVHFRQPQHIPQTLQQLAPSVNGTSTASLHEIEEIIFGKPDVPIFTVPTRIAEQKGIEYAIEVSAAYAKQHGSVLLAITGPVDTRKEANRRYWEKVQRIVALTAHSAPNLKIAFLGGIEWLYMPWFYQRSDLVLLPFRNEGFGLPVVEGMLQRTPVLISDDPALLETSAGFAPSVPLSTWMDNPDFVARKIHEYIGSGKVGQDCIAMRQRAERHFSMHGVKQQLLAVLEL